MVVLGPQVLCDAWPSSASYGCTSDGNGLTILDTTVLGTYDCQRLCQNYGGEDGCCFSSSSLGCWWKAGASVSSEQDDNAFAVKCFIMSKIASLYIQSLILLD